VKPEDDLPVMLWRARPDMSCEYVNRAWLEFTGFSADEAQGEGWSRVVHAEDLARWLDACVRAFDARTPFALEYRMRRHDGAYRWVLERGSPQRSAEGAFTGFLGACIEIDEHKRALAALARLHERERRLRIATEEASHAKDALLASVLAELQPPSEAAARLLELVRVDPAQALFGHPLDAPLLAGVRVLVVEADPQVRELLLKVLRVAGAEAWAVERSEQVLNALEKWRPDVMLSDPGRDADDGYLLLQRQNASRAMAGGYDAQLAKPVEPVALLATVARLMQPASV
jgi:PAS domain S-box-containing protein